MILRLVLTVDDPEAIVAHIENNLFKDTLGKLTSELLYNELVEHYDSVIAGSDNDPLLTEMLYGGVDCLSKYIPDFTFVPKYLVRRGETAKEDLYFPLIFLNPVKPHDYLRMMEIFKEPDNGNQLY